MSVNPIQEKTQFSDDGRWQMALVLKREWQPI